MDTKYLTNVAIITVNSQNEIFRNAYIGIRNDRIVELGKMTDFPAQAKLSCIDYENKVAVLPGLIDSHSHSSLLKGYTENRQLLNWLGEYQREHQVLTEQDAYAAGLISYTEALLGGTTMVVDMYRYPKSCMQAAENVGIRANLVPYAADVEGKTFFETLETTEDFIKLVREKKSPRVQGWIGLEHLFYCSQEMFRKARNLADKYDVPIHTHTSEQKEEVDAVLSHFGARPIEVLRKFGILKPYKTTLAHCVWLSDEEIKILKEYKIGVIHCPTSNAKLACGIADIQAYRSNGIAVALGSDGSISNNSLSMFECMKFGSLLQKTKHLDAGALNANFILRLATIDAAQTFGMDADLGSIEIGKKADLIAIDLYQPHLLPIQATEEHDPLIWNLIYSGRASDVLDVWIDGEQVVKNRKLTRIDVHEVMDVASRQTKDLLRRRFATKAVPMIS